VGQLASKIAGKQAGAAVADELRVGWGCWLKVVAGGGAVVNYNLRVQFKIGFSCNDVNWILAGFRLDQEARHAFLPGGVRKAGSAFGWCLRLGSGRDP